MLGVATPTEAAATGVVGAICLAADVSPARLSDWSSMRSMTAATVAPLMLIIMCVGGDVQPAVDRHGRCTELGENSSSTWICPRR